MYYRFYETIVKLKKLLAVRSKVLILGPLPTTRISCRKRLAMFPLIFCNLCAQKLWRGCTFLEMTNVCATTQLLTTSSAISLVYATAGTFFALGGR